MRILLASHNYPPIVSGVTVLVQKLAHAMASRGHTVVVLTGMDRARPEFDDDGGIRLLRVGGVSNPWWKETVIPWVSRRRLGEILREFRPEVVHTHDTGTLGVQIVRTPRVAPVLASCHFVPRVTARYISWGSRTLDLMEVAVWVYTTTLFGRFDHIVYNTEAQRKFYFEHKVRVPSTLVPAGIDLTRYCPVAPPGEVVEASYGLPPRPRVLFVSRLMKDKEIEVLIRAMPRVRAEREAHLLLVGRGDHQPNLEALVAQLGMGPYVHFLGFVPEDDMPAIYRACDLFAMPSPFEVLSLPTLQAMATAMPVVAANAVALPELVADGVNGFLTPPGDADATAAAILRILGDEAMARRMGEASLTRAEPHAEERTFDQYEQLYAQLAHVPAPVSS